MSKPKGHIKAFTMVDVLTGLVVTSIIISMVFYLFTSVNRQVHMYGSTHTELNAFLLLKSDLKQQVDKAIEITEIPNGVQVKKEDGEIAYVQEGDLLLRKINGIADTLTHQLHDFKWKTEPAFKPNLPERVTVLEIKVGIEKQTLTALFFKDYGKSGAINQYLLNEF